MRVSLDIDSIPEALYLLLLEAFRSQFGNVDYGEWEITAEKEE